MDTIRQLLMFRKRVTKKHYYSEALPDSESMNTSNINNEVCVDNTNLEPKANNNASNVDCRNIQNMAIDLIITTHKTNNTDLLPILTEAGNKIHELHPVDLTKEDSGIGFDIKIENPMEPMENYGNSPVIAEGFDSHSEYVEISIDMGKNSEVNNDISITDPKIDEITEISEKNNNGIHSDSINSFGFDENNTNSDITTAEPKNVETEKNNVANTEIDNILTVIETDENRDLVDFENIMQSFLIFEPQNKDAENIIDIDQYFNHLHDVYDPVGHSDTESNNNDVENESSEKINANRNKTSHVLDKISINSTNLSDDGYNSSDFEFITEEEAVKDGFIINFNIKNAKINYFHNYSDENETNEAGPSGINNSVDSCFVDGNFVEKHVVPVGDDYLALFQGRYDPALSDEIRFWENKSIQTSPINWQYDGIGFDRQMAVLTQDIHSSDDEYADEAKENAKKILHMYSSANRKRRRWRQ